MEECKILLSRPLPQETTPRKTGASTHTVPQWEPEHLEAYDAMPVPVLVLRSDAVILFANSLFEEITGCAREALIGATAPLPWCGEDRGREHWRRIAQGGLRCTLFCRNREHGCFQAEIHARPVYREDTHSHTVVTLHDATEAKQREQQMEKKAQSMRDLLAYVSHEIRSPLNGIVGFSELLQDTPLTEEQQEYLSYIHHSSSELNELAEEALTCSRLEATEASPEPEPTWLRRFFRNAAASPAHQAEHKGLGFRLSLDTSLPEVVELNQHHLHQILSNLTNNAIKYTDSGSVTVAVDCGARRGRTLELRISVADTGRGVPPGRQKAIFEAFTQDGESPRVGPKGVGLGLTIVDRLVDQLGGALHLESTPGEGSTFSVAIPVTLPEEEQ